MLITPNFTDSLNADELLHFTSTVDGRRRHAKLQVHSWIAFWEVSAADDRIMKLPYSSIPMQNDVNIWHKERGDLQTILTVENQMQSNEADNCCVQLVNRLERFGLGLVKN